MAIKKANGERVGAVPYGYDLAANGTTLVPNPVEQSVLTDMRAMRSNGTTLREIAYILTDRNVPTKTGKSTRWTHSAIARILNRTQIATTERPLCTRNSA